MREESDANLDQLIEEATVDADDESEQVLGFYTMLEAHLELPFQTSVLDVRVNVDAVELTDADRIVAACSRSGVRQNLDLLDLPLPKPLPRGAEWIEAYRRWARRR
ncbi:MAG: hypothetical protein HYV07_13310 [Deltaproteobacteria bacterium]|nr:hypothetical protein [Deltaproteobacteria bacterium]